LVRLHVYYALFHRQTDVGLQETEGGFRTQVYTVTDRADIDYAGVRAELNRNSRGSPTSDQVGLQPQFCGLSFALGSIGLILVASSFIPTPSSLLAKHALVNVYNRDDNMCLYGPSALLAILAKKMPKGFRNTGRI
jgi:hypothetical protein